MGVDSEDSIYAAMVIYIHHYECYSDLLDRLPDLEALSFIVGPLSLTPGWGSSVLSHDNTQTGTPTKA